MCVDHVLKYTILLCIPVVDTSTYIYTHAHYTQMRYQEQQKLQPYQKGEIELPEEEVKKLGGEITGNGNIGLRCPGH